MRRFRTEWHRAIVFPISKLVNVVGGLGGRGRRRSQTLESTLASLYDERDRLYREVQELQLEIQELVHYTDAEINHLRQTIEHLRQERDTLQLQVWNLEERQTALFLKPVSVTEPDSENHYEQERDYGPKAQPMALPKTASVPLSPPPVDRLGSVVLSASLEDSNAPLDVPNESSAEPESSGAMADEEPAPSPLPIDLSNLRLALVGGHPSTRRGVIRELQLNYGLRHWVEIPRMTESNTNRSKVKSKIARCTLVVLITGYMSHRLTEIVFSLKEAGSLAGDVLQLNCTGKSGVVREILNHLGEPSS